jgi:2-polyprenyl-3-methyl-5-hydroxy-6-metoxy-1,4-benzoquinol methylase
MASVRALHDDRYGYPGVFNLARCPGCGHQRLLSSLDEKAIADLYTRYYPRKSLDPGAWKPHRETRGPRAWWRGDGASAFRLVPRGVRVLDIGCGWGESLGFYMNRGCQAEGVETDSNAAIVAERHGLKIRIGLFRADDYPEASFDWAVLDQVLEHMGDPRSTLSQVVTVLRPGGHLALALPNGASIWKRIFGERWIHWHAPYHLHFFTARSLNRMANECGLTIERRRTTSPSDWLFYQWVHLFSFPPERQPSAFWGKGTPGPSYRWIIRLGRLLRAVGAFHFLTRLADGLGIGDNAVYVLTKRPA